MDYISIVAGEYFASNVLFKYEIGEINNNWYAIGGREEIFSQFKRT